MRRKINHGKHAFLAWCVALHRCNESPIGRSRHVHEQTHEPLRLQRSSRCIRSGAHRWSTGKQRAERNGESVSSNSDVHVTRREDGRILMSGAKPCCVRDAYTCSTPKHLPALQPAANNSMKTIRLLRAVSRDEARCPFQNEVMSFDLVPDFRTV